MKLRKLLKEVRRCGLYYVDEILEPTYDGKQLQVIKWIPMPPGCKSLTFKYDRFKTYDECYAYIDQLKWKRIQYNIDRLRKKYKRPSKSKNKDMGKYPVLPPASPPPPSYDKTLRDAINVLNRLGCEYEIKYKNQIYTKKYEQRTESL